MSIPFLSRLRALVGVSSGLRPGGDARRRSGVYRTLQVLLIGGGSLFVMGSYGCQSCRRTFAAQLLGSLAGNPRSHGVTGKVLGTDGSQTGIASFLGNFTTITQPAGGYFVMDRSADCSLSLIVGTSSLNASASINSQTLNYERTLHQLAGLTTTADVYAGGCATATTGLSTSPGVKLVRASNAPYVFALAAGNGSTNAVFILTANAALTGGTFVPITTLPSASGVATADLNGDGVGDLVVVNSYNAASAFVSVVLGNSDGTFANPVSYATGGSKSVAAVVDDVNGDGKLDLVVVGDDQTVSVLLGKGDGTYGAAMNFAAPLPGSSVAASTPVVNVITADVNGDGKKDIVGSNGLVLLGNGDGTFRSVSTVAFPYMTATSSEGPNLAAGDLNKDGTVDLVVNTGSTISVWLGNGDGTFTAGAAYGSIANSGFVTVADLDGDGNLDIYSGLSSNGMFSGDDVVNAASYVLMGKGDGTFVGAPVAAGAYTGANLADVNGDGYPDLIVPTTGVSGGQTAVFTVELGSAKGVFTPGATITVPVTVTFTVSEYVSPVTESTTNLTPSSYAVGDVNGDGKADVVYVANYRGYAVLFVALGRGDGTFGAAVATGFPQIAAASGYDTSTTIGGIRLADLNHDGNVDVLFNFNDATGGASGGGYVQGLGVLPGKGNATFGAPLLTYTYNSPTAPTTAYLPTPVTVADLNGDGSPDVVATYQSFALVGGSGVTTSTVQVYVGKGDGTFAAPTAAVTTTHLGQVAVADLNKDGRLDIAALTETSGSQAQLSIALGKGDGTFGTATTSSLLGGDAIRTAGLVAADFNADGLVDLALLGSNDYSGVLYGKGDGTFTSVPLSGGVIPKDLITLGVSGQAVAVDLNKDGKVDILAGQTVLLNLYGNAPVVTQYASTTVSSAAPSAIAPGGSTTLTATVTGGTGSTTTPGGVVTFVDGTTTLGTGVVDATGKATLTTTALTTTGGHSLTAGYGGDATFLASTSAAVTVTVTPVVTSVATTTVVAALPTTGVVGTSVVLTATVSAASGVAAGTVTFLDGATSLGMGTLDGTGKAVLATSSLAVGVHSVTASYAGGTGFAGSVSGAVVVTITAATVADFSLSVSPGSATVTRGGSTTAVVALSPIGGFKVATTLSCGGAPANTTCTVTPGTVTSDGTNNATATVTITTSAATAQVRGVRGIEYAGLGIAGVLVLAGLGRRRRLVSGLLVLVMGAWMVGVSGCGGKAASAAGGTPVGTYGLTVTGTAGSLSHQANFTLTVQ